MDKLTGYRELVKRFLTDYAALMDSQPTPNLETVLVFDDEHHQYLLREVGWSDHHRIRNTLLHIRCATIRFGLRRTGRKRE
jgi:hypothetical protein